MLTMYKDEVKAFARNPSLFFREIREIPAPPVNRCRMRRGRGRCRGTASELALTQMCAYHQERRTGYLNVGGLRCMSTSNPGLFRLMFRDRASAHAASPPCFAFFFLFSLFSLFFFCPLFSLDPRSGFPPTTRAVIRAYRQRS